MAEYKQIDKAKCEGKDIETSEEKERKDHIKRFYDGWCGDLNNE